MEARPLVFVLDSASSPSIPKDLTNCSTCTPQKLGEEVDGGLGFFEPIPTQNGLNLDQEEKAKNAHWLLRFFMNIRASKHAFGLKCREKSEKLRNLGWLRIYTGCCRGVIEVKDPFRLRPSWF